MKENTSNKRNSKISRRKVLQSSGAGLAGSVAISQSVFAKSEVGNLDQDEFLWTHNFHTPHLTGVSKQSDSLYLGVKNRIVQVDSESGERTQSKETSGGHITVAPLLTNHGVLALSAGNITLLEYDSLDEKWSISTNQRPNDAKIEGNTAYINFEQRLTKKKSGKVVALSVSTGDFEWEFQLEHGASGIVGLPSNNVVVAESSGRLIKISRRGDKRWDVETRTPINTKPTVDESAIYLKDTGRRDLNLQPQAYRINRGSGKITHTLEGNRQARGTKYLVSDASLIGATETGIEVRSESNLSTNSTLEMQNPVRSIGQNDQVVIGNSGKDLFSIDKKQFTLIDQIGLPERYVCSDRGGAHYTGTAGQICVENQRAYVSTQAGVLAAAITQGEQ